MPARGITKLAYIRSEAVEAVSGSVWRLERDLLRDLEPLLRLEPIVAAGGW